MKKYIGLISENCEVLTIDLVEFIEMSQGSIDEYLDGCRYHSYAVENSQREIVESLVDESFFEDIIISDDTKRQAKKLNENKIKSTIKREKLEFIEKSSKEIEIIYSSCEFLKKRKNYKAWIESKEHKIQCNKSIKEILKEFEDLQEEKIKDMIKVMLSEIELLSNNKMILFYIGEYNKDEYGNLRRTLIFNGSDSWKSTLESIWNKINEMGYKNFYSYFGEQYGFKTFYREETDFDRWGNQNE